MTIIKVYAKNIKTNEVIDMGDFDTVEQAKRAIVNVEYDDDEIPEDWDFEIEAEDYDDDWDYNEDEGFDPYEGCYTFDC